MMRKHMRQEVLSSMSTRDTALAAARISGGMRQKKRLAFGVRYSKNGDKRTEYSDQRVF